MTQSLRPKAFAMVAGLPKGDYNLQNEKIQNKNEANFHSYYMYVPNKYF